MEWKNLYRGFAMGVSDLIPGVSGGTIAFILGIYDRLLEAISSFFSREWKKQLSFLIPLGIGMISAILLLSRGIEYLLEKHYEPTQFFFLGLIIGVIPFLIQQSEARQTFKAIHILIMAAGIVLLGILALLESIQPMQIGESLQVNEVLILFGSGWLASMAMLLPGISGSFILLLIGVYPVVIEALSSLDIVIIAIVGAGVVLGFIISSKLIRQALDHFPYITYAAIIGLIVGSVFVVFPGMPMDVNEWLVCALTFLIGFSSAFLSGKYAA